MLHEQARVRNITPPYLNLKHENGGG